MHWTNLLNYRLALLPEFAWFPSPSMKPIPFGLCVLGISAVLYLGLSWLVNRRGPMKQTKAWGIVVTLFVLVQVITLFSIASLSTIIPFAPIYLGLTLLLFNAALLVLAAGVWLRLRKLPSAPPLAGVLRASWWLQALGYTPLLAPLLLFHVPVFDHANHRIFGGLLVLMLLIYLASLYLLLPNLFRLSGLQLPVEQLPEPLRLKLEQAVEALDLPPKHRVLVARSGLRNALAIYGRRQIIVGRDLIEQLDALQLRAVLLHELGHLQDRTYLPRIARSVVIGSFLLAFSTLYVASRITLFPFDSLLILLAAGYFLFVRIHRQRLGAEVFADSYVRETDADLYPALKSGLASMQRLNGVDKDFCKKNNHPHLDLDERVGAVESGIPVKRRRSWEKVLSFLLTMVAAVTLSLMYQEYFPSADTKWSKLHRQFHSQFYHDEPAALATITQALQLAEEEFGHNARKTYTSLNDLTKFYLYQEQTEQAERYAQAAVEVGIQVYGDQHLQIVRSLKNLGQVRYQQDDIAAAAELYSRALTVQEQQQADEEDRVATMEWLLWLYKELEAPTKAIQLHEKLIALAAAKEGVEGRKKYLEQLQDLVDFLTEVKEYDQAQPFVEKSQEVAATSFGETSQEYANTLLAAAKLQRAKGHVTKAVDLCDQSLRITATASGDSSDDFANALFTRAALYADSGERGKSTQTLQRILQLHEKRGGNEGEESIYLYWRVGLASSDLEQWPEAEAYFRKVAALEEQDTETESEDLIETYTELLITLKAQGKTAEIAGIEQRIAELGSESSAQP